MTLHRQTLTHTPSRSTGECPMNLQDPDLFRNAALIDGGWFTRAEMAVINPANGETLGELPDCTAAETTTAIAAAERAMVGWRARSHAERADMLMRWYDLILENTEDLAQILTAEQGKPLSESRGEVAYGASFVRWFAEEARRINGKIIPSPVAGKKILAMKEPVGVCAIITPWNFPIAMITRKVAPGLAAGCTMVIKPSDFTPYSALALAVLAERAGIPAGVLNILTGKPEAIGATLTASLWCANCPSPARPAWARFWRNNLRRRSSGSVWNWAETRPSSCSMTPIWTRQSKARCSRSSATAARPASAPIGSWCNRGSMTPLSRRWQNESMR